jgi:uncharacterized SAM-binding protein YcdF (DUF218 family)
MLFWLKKVVSFWLMPLPLCLAAIVSGLLLLRYTRRRRLGRFLIIAPIVVLLVASNKFVAKSLMRSLETQFPAIPEFTPDSPLPPAVAACRYVVILGGGNGYPGPRRLQHSLIRRPRPVPRGHASAARPARGKDDCHRRRP